MEKLPLRKKTKREKEKFKGGGCQKKTNLVVTTRNWEKKKKKKKKKKTKKKTNSKKKTAGTNAPRQRPHRSKNEVTMPRQPHAKKEVVRERITQNAQSPENPGGVNVRIVRKGGKPPLLV